MLDGARSSGCTRRRGPGLLFELREPRERFAARRAAHFQLRLQARTACGTLGRTEDCATQIVAELHAAHASGLAMRHAGNRARDRRRDAARAAIGAARVIVGAKCRGVIHYALPETCCLRSRCSRTAAQRSPHCAIATCGAFGAMPATRHRSRAARPPAVREAGRHLASPSVFRHNPRFAAGAFALRQQAQVVKQVDAGDSKSPAARRAGSSPALGTS